MKIIINEEQLKRIINEEVEGNNIFILVGPPSVGKSTWIKNYFNKNKPYIISRDDIVDNIAESYGFTYDELFKSPNENIDDVHPKYGKVITSPSWMYTKLSYEKIANANKEVNDELESRILNAKNENNVVVDMTNMGVKPRKSILNKLTPILPNHKKIAVVFNFKGGEDMIKKMAQKRADDYKLIGKSKTIPTHVFDSMFKNYQDVSNDEGFDEIMHVDNIPIFKNYNKR
jgi:predicted kinase